MRVLAIFAIIGLVSAQHGRGGPQHNFNQQGGGNIYPDQGQHPGGGSRGLGKDFGYNKNFQHHQPNYPNQPYNQQVGNNYPDQGLSPGQQGGSSQGLRKGFGLNTNIQQHPSLGNVNQVNHHNIGQAPPNTGGSSKGRTFDYVPVGQQPMSSNVNHNNIGQAPVNTGGSSGIGIIPDGPVQTGMNDRVQMVNVGGFPDPADNNNPNSGEFNWDAAGGAIGAANNAPQAAGGVGGNSGYNNNNQVAYAAGQGQAGGNSGGFGGPAYNALDNGAANHPIGGALLTDKAQRDAGKPQHLHGAVNAAPTIAGVVVAVVVLVGVVAVAAVFLVKQRSSRMMVASV